MMGLLQWGERSEPHVFFASLFVKKAVVEEFIKGERER